MIPGVAGKQETYEYHGIANLLNKHRVPLNTPFALQLIGTIISLSLLSFQQGEPGLYITVKLGSELVKRCEERMTRILLFGSSVRRRRHSEWYKL